ncbi:MAG: hypothetical protein MUE41_05775 [Gemmatimonadaceae bacterium]|nr:hypothetical protein [Gemmatimonadaceae bacterium]
MRETFGGRKLAALVIGCLGPDFIACEDVQMRRMQFAVAVVLLIPGRGAVAQLRPLDPPRACAGAPSVVAAVDTTIDLGAGKPPTWLRPVGRGGPRYPVAERNARIEGEVRASFAFKTQN